MPTYSEYRALFKGQRMPFAFVDLDLFDANCQAILQRAQGTKLRIASKSLRCLSLIKRVLETDKGFQGIMSFTAEESLMLSQAGFDDILMGYPTWHHESIRALAGEIRQGKSIIFMLDSLEHIAHLESIGKAENAVLPVCIDLDMAVDFRLVYFGVRRSTIKTVKQILSLYAAIEKSPHLRLEGVMGYEAQIAGVIDNSPTSQIKNQLIRWLKSQSIPQIAERRAMLVEALTARGANLRFVNAGGTGSIESSIAEACVTEVTVGSGFYSPTLFDQYTAFKHQPAAAFAIEIVRQPKAGLYTCLGGGYIASGSVGLEKQPQVYLPEGAKLTPLEGAGEVQTPVEYTGSEKLGLGEPIFMRHSKAGELCERFNRLLLVSQGRIVEEVPTYRGQGWAFL